MSVSSIYVLHGIQTPNSFYSQIEDSRPSPRVQAVLQYGSGYPQPLFKGFVGFKPEITFRTTQLATLLAETGLLGANLSGGNTDLIFRNVTDLGSRDATSATTGIRLRMENAMMYVKSISASHQGRATAEVRLCGIYDGTNPPIIPTGSVAITGTPSAAEYFGLGPVEINSTTLDGVQDMSIDLGTETYERGSASDIFDTFIAIKQINPKVTIRGLATEPWTTYGLTGTQLTALACFLRKVNNKATGGLAYVANATAQHIAFGATAGTIVVDDTQAGGNSEAMTGLILDLIAPSTTAGALTISTASAIT
ncbi:MAG TPA: hypothetical protein VGG64_12665 [Pirellulales bacterium]|jgi:hypothetical protein